MKVSSGILLSMAVLLIVVTLCLLDVRKRLDNAEARLDRLEGRGVVIEAVQSAIREKIYRVEYATQKCYSKLDDVEDRVIDVEDQVMGFVPENVEERQEVVSNSEPEWQDYVLRVLTAEAGDDEVLCGCVAQCVYNACQREGWEYTPAGIMQQYGYTAPASWISGAARRAYDQVFCSGVTYTEVADALYFYAPKYCESAWHESQRFIAEIHGVRFFGRWE